MEWKKIYYNNYDHSDMYFTYKLNEEERNEYLNKWFIGNINHHHDEMITLKEVDDDTIMYGQKYNPVSIKIHLQYPNTKMLSMKAQIHSIDDSSYGIWWDNVDKKDLKHLMETRETLMQWIDSKPILNGEEFLNYCVTLGADPNTKDYN